MSIILLSTHALPIDMLRDLKSYVSGRNGAICELVCISHVHLEYTTYIRKGGCG